MSEKEAIEAIISEPKFYIGVMPQSTASNFLASYRKGMAKQKTINEFLNKFGYFVLRKTEWANHNTYFTENTSFIDRNFIEDIFESLNNVAYVVVPYCKKLKDKDAALLKNIGLDYDYDESSCLRIFRKQLDGKPKELKTK